ncbi:MAG TPA: L-lactate dehydrogenase [Clostridiales bacterium]|nr:L-lactate dehydrogenase [Clostridiales bacterium]
MQTHDKVVIIGAGYVGATSAYALMTAGTVSEIVLLDVNEKKLEGEVMDLNHGISFVPPVVIRSGDYEDCRDADIILLAAGAGQKPGETRLDLLKKNIGIFQEILPKVMQANEKAILLVVTNPVDLLTYATLKISGLPRQRVIGTGTLLDSSRFKYLLSRNCRVDPRNVHAYIIGEHGDSEVPAWSLTNIAGTPLDRYCQACCMPDSSCCDRESIFREVRDAAYRIIEGKGATYYAVGLAVRRIVETILRNESSILPVSSLMTGQYGVEDVCLSLPAIVDRQGIAKVLELPLDPAEVQGFRESARILKAHLKEAGFKEADSNGS